MTFLKSPGPTAKFVTGHEKHFQWILHQIRSTLEPGLRAQKFVLTEDTGAEVPQR